MAVIVWPPIERERKQSQVFFSNKLLFIYTTGHKRERAKARDKKTTTKEMFFVTKTTLEFYGGGEKFKKRNASDQQDENE